jgi:hypothetical protein
VKIAGKPLKLKEKYAIGMTTFSGSGKVVDTINLDTPRIIEHDDGIGVGFNLCISYFRFPYLNICRPF